MVKSWPEFYSDYDGSNSFWKFWDLDQKNPVLKIVIFSANILVYEHPIGPKLGLMDSFLTLNKMTEEVFENSKILQNFGIKIQSHHSLAKFSDHEHDFKHTCPPDSYRWWTNEKWFQGDYRKFGKCSRNSSKNNDDTNKSCIK